MGSRKTNFYVDLTHRFGFGEVADEVQSPLPGRQARGGLRGDPRRARRRDLADRAPRTRSPSARALRRRPGVDRLIVSPISAEPEQRPAHGRAPGRAGGRRRRPPERGLSTPLGTLSPRLNRLSRCDEGRRAERDRRGRAPRGAGPRRRALADRQGGRGRDRVGRRRGGRAPRRRVRGGRRHAWAPPTTPGAPTSSLQVAVPTADEIGRLRSGQVLIGHLAPLTSARDQPGAGRGGRDQLRDGGDPADHPRPGDGRALLAGERRRLRGHAARRARGRAASSR